jgi:hypothetical protein
MYSCRLSSLHASLVPKCVIQDPATQERENPTITNWLKICFALISSELSFLGGARDDNDKVKYISHVRDYMLPSIALVR